MSKQKKRIGCLGSGRLSQAVQSLLEPEYEWLSLSIEDLADQSQEQSLQGLSMILYCDDHWRFRTQHKLNGLCQVLGVPWLRVYCEFGVGIIGPCVLQTEAGCVACVETRRRVVMKDPADFIFLCKQNEKDLRARDEPWLTSSSLAILAQLVVKEVFACLESPDTLQTRRALLHIPLDTFHVQRHCFQPEPECPVCGRLPQDTPLAASITLQARPKLSPSTYRTRQLISHAKEIFAAYLDTQTGMISTLFKDTVDSVALVTTWIGASFGENQSHMSGTGRQLSYEQSELAAIAEALERYGGVRPKGKRTQIWASYRQLGEQALDPTTLGLHTPLQYALPGYRYVPYHHDLSCYWVWGYSFGRKQPVLVPEHCAYYGLHRSSKEHTSSSFVYECSNGCALGNGLEEAIFYGILEVAERDAFLLAWYAQLGLPRLDMRSATDPHLRLMLENLEHMSGYTIHVWNSTLDHGVPCCMVMAVDEQDRAGMPKAVCGAGSHPNPEQAVLNALLELDFKVKKVQAWYPERERQRALQMLTDSLVVKEMGDHSLLYYLPEAFERLSFLYHSPQLLRTFQEAFRDFYQREPHLDLSADLRALIDHYLARDIDIIVVDQTTPEHAAQDFRCVKIIMPGMLPMTFGHQYRRNSGFQRLYHLPVQLGYRSEPLTDLSINPHPHPFP